MKPDASFPLHRLEYPKISLKPWTLENDSVLKLSFGIVDTASNKAFVPQRAHVRFTDAQTGATTLLPVQIKSKGKARFDIVSRFLAHLTTGRLRILPRFPKKQKSSALPASLRSSSGQQTITILLGHPSNDIRPLEYTIGTISLPASRLLPLPKGRHDLSAKKEGEPAFVVQPEIRWTFEKEEKVISKGVSALGTGIVVAAPLAVWAVTVRPVSL